MNNERTIKLTMTDELRGSVNARRQTFLISLTALNGAEIRFAHAAIASRDKSVETSVGLDPEPITITLAVEEVQ